MLKLSPHLRQALIYNSLCQQRATPASNGQISTPSLMASPDHCNLSSGARAVQLLAGLSQDLEFFMDRADCRLPFQPNFGVGWGRDPFFNPTGQPSKRPPATSQTKASPQRRSGEEADGGAKVRPLQQSNGRSCGQASVAMCVNSVTGKKLTDRDIHAKYGFGLLHALNSESRSAGYQWKDGGNFTAKNWPSLEKRLNQEKTPVMIGLNGQFSPSGRGHIVALLSIEGDKVTYADPANGQIKTTSKRAIEQAPPHPDGKFFFYASKLR